MNKMLLVFMLLPMGSCAMDALILDENPEEALLGNNTGKWDEVSGETETRLVHLIMDGHPVIGYLLKQLNSPAGGDGKVKLLAVFAGRYLGALEYTGVNGQLKGEENRLVAGGSSDLRILNADTCECEATLAHKYVNGGFTGAGNMIVTTGDHKVKTWDVVTGVCMRTFDHSCVLTAQLNGKENVLVSSSYASAKIWDLDTGMCVATLPLGTVGIEHLNGKTNWLFTAGGNQVKIWNPNTWECEATFYQFRVTKVRLNRAGTMLATNGCLDEIKIWDVNAGKCVAMFYEGDAKVKFMQFSGTGNQLVTYSDDKTWGYGDGEVKIWDLSDLPPTDEDYPDIDSLSDQAVNDGNLRLLSVSPGRYVRTFKHDGVNNVRITRERNWLVTADGGKVKFLNVDTCEWKAVLEHDDVIEVLLNRKEDRFVTAGDNKVRIWNAYTGKCVATFDHQRVASAQLNRKENRLVTSSLHEIKLWNIITGKCVATLKHDGRIGEGIGFGIVQFNRAGSMLAIAVCGDLIKILNAYTGKCVAVLKHDGVTFMHFSMTGDRLVTFGGKMVKTWDLSALLPKDEDSLISLFTLKQAIILNAVYEVVLTRGLVRKFGKKAFCRKEDSLGYLSSLASYIGSDLFDEELLTPEEIAFDFNRYSHLWKAYQSLPAAIQIVLAPYVTRPEIN